MQLKALLVASLVAVSSAADVEERQISIPTEALTAIPTEVLTAIPTELLSNIPQITQDLGQYVSLFGPLITALPLSVIEEIGSAFQTAQPTDIPGLISDFITYFPTDVQSSILAIESSLAGAVPTVTGAVTMTTDTDTMPAETMTDSATETESMMTSGSMTSGSMVTSMTSGSRTGTGTGTGAPASTSSTPSSGSKTFIGFSVLSLAGVLGLVLAL